MNIKQAKEIPTEKIANHLGGKQAQTKGDEIWFHSPFRPNESTPSFKVNLKLNTWYDFGSGQGGSVLDLWLDFHQLNRKDGKAIKTALEGLRSFSKESPARYQRSGSVVKELPKNDKAEEKRFTLIKQPTRIWLDSLKVEQARRGIGKTIADKYLKQAYFKDNHSGKSFNGFAFRNDLEGFEISVPNPNKGISFKTVIGAKAPTTFVNRDSDTALVFEGFWDYLSFLEIYKQPIPEQEIIVLNSLSFVRDAAESLIRRKDRIKKVFLFQDNDDAGEKAVILISDLLEPEGFSIGTMNHIYEGKKDLNDFWMESPNYKPNQASIKEYLDSQWQMVERKNFSGGNKL